MKGIQSLIVISAFVAFSSAGKINPRIIGGEAARAGQFPFAAAINTRTPTYVLFCGGTLISNQWILTAGQCVKDAIQFTIQLGSNELLSVDPNRVTLSSSTYVLHPEYDPITTANDIGLIKLHLPVTFTEYIKPASVGKSDLLEGIRTTAIGWGQTSDDVAGTSNHLNFVQLTTLSNTECRLTYGNALLDSMVCASGNYNEGACLEDTGSGLITSLVSWHWVVGISSFVSGNGCESTDPSGYTRVAPYTDWIANITEVIPTY